MFLIGFIVFAIVCVALVYFVLLQEPKQGGLSSSLGGGSNGGGSDFLGGRGITGGLIRITAILAAVFFVLAIVLNKIREF